MNGVFDFIGRWRFLPLFTLLHAGFDIPMSRLVQTGAEYLHTGTGITIPTVNDLLPDSIAQLIPEISLDL